MTKKLHIMLLSSLTLLVLVVSAVQPMIVRADDSTPPAPAAPASSGDNSSGEPSAAPASNDTQDPVAAEPSAAPASTAVSPASTSVAPSDTSAAPEDTSVPATDASATSAPSADASATAAAPTDTTAAPTDSSTLVGSVPTDTAVVVLDATGTPVPLATQAAAEIVKTGDPIWCPTGKAPGDSVCAYASYTSSTSYTGFSTFGGADGLLLALRTNPTLYSGDGTIYIEYNYDPATVDGATQPDLGGIIFDSTLQNYDVNPEDGKLGDLTLQGGWDFTHNTLYAAQNYTDFGATQLTVMGWDGDVTIKDIVISGTTSTGLWVTTNSTSSGKGNIALHHVTSNSNRGAGAFLDNRIGANISVDNSTFGDASGENGNGDQGLEAWSNGEITLTNVIADGNGNDGAYLNNASLDPIITNSEFNGNSANGLEVHSSGDVQLTHVIADDNGYDGALLGYSGFDGADQFYNRIGGNVTITGGDFSNNYGYGNSADPAGLEVYADGSIQVSGITADSNGSMIEDGEVDIYPADGAYLDNGGSGDIGIINITSSMFNDNFGDSETGAGGRGLVAHSNSDITLTNVTASNNSAGGAELDNCHHLNTIPFGCTSTGTGSIHLSGNNMFKDNGFNLAPSVGLFASSNYDISLNGVTALGNGYMAGGGAFLEAGRDLSITNSVFNENCTMCLIGFGIEASSGRNTSLQGVSADSNGTDLSGGEEIAIGAGIVSGGTVSIVNSDFSNQCVLGYCGGIGLSVFSGGEITLTGVSADANSMYGAELNTGLDPIITNSHFDNNGGDGLYIDTSYNNADVTINCSTASGNGRYGPGYGLDGDLGSGTLTLNGVAMSGNSSGNNNVASGATVIKQGNCGGGKSGILGESGSLPWNTINVLDSGDQGHGLDCSQYVGTELVLSNGDHALLPCPIGSTPGSSGSINRLTSNRLPGPTLDSKFTFVSAFDVEVKPSLSGGMVTVSFKIPSGKQGAKFAILHWDGSNWVNMGGSINPPGYFSIDTSLTGDFVLVTQ